MLLLTLFAGLALGLATIGVYGVIAYLVGGSTREIGIRMALGATPGGIVALVVRQGAGVALLGLGLGLAGALLLTGFMRGLLFGVSARDPLTFGAIAVLLSSAAVLASYVPARRAARVDPTASLRSE
jgi:ABC-type antimicrobial peptide transport system permease subunit